MAEFLVALADFDRQRLWQRLGHASLFSFLLRHLGLSKSSAFYRQTAVQLMQRFPEVVPPLRDGRLCLTAMVELARVMTPENRAQVLPRFFRLSKRDAKAMAAEIGPCKAPPRRELVTAVRPGEPPHHQVATRTTAEGAVLAGGSAAAAPSRTVACVPPGQTGVPSGAVQSGAANPAALQSSAPQLGAAAAAGTEALPLLGPDPSQSFGVEPLTANLRRIHFTVSKRFLAKLDDVRAALSHSRPRATAEEILEAGLDLLLEQAAKRNGATERPQKEQRPSAPGRFPAKVRRAIWERDQGRCQWKFESGEICGSKVRVEVDHIVPRALGGESTVENGQLLCGPHNRMAARYFFGDNWMDRFTRSAGAPATRGPQRPSSPQQRPDSREQHPASRLQQPPISAPPAQAHRMTGTGPAG